MAAIEIGGVRLEIRGLRGVATLAGIGLIVAAVTEQLQRPASQRTWHGKLWGVVPYDLRPPTYARMLSAYWNPASEQLIGDKAFGVGWDINVAALRRKLGLTQGDTTAQ